MLLYFINDNVCTQLGDFRHCGSGLLLRRDQGRFCFCSEAGLRLDWILDSGPYISAGFFVLGSWRICHRLFMLCD